MISGICPWNQSNLSSLDCPCSVIRRRRLWGIGRNGPMTAWEVEDSACRCETFWNPRRAWLDWVRFEVVWQRAIRIIATPAVMDGWVWRRSICFHRRRGCPGCVSSETWFHQQTGEQRRSFSDFAFQYMFVQCMSTVSDCSQPIEGWAVQAGPVAV